MNAIWISLAVLLVLSGPVALALTVISLARQKRIEEALGRLEQRPRPEPGFSPGPAPVPPPPPARTPGPSPGAARDSARAYRPAGDLESWVGARWLTGAGILAILVGTAFFLAQDLGASPLAGVGQVLVGLTVGSAFLVLGRLGGGVHLRFTRLGLIGGAIGLYYLTAYAAHAFYRLVPGFVALPFLFAAAVVGAVLALSEDSRFVAGLTLAGAFLAPLFLKSAADPAGTLFPYLLAVGLGAAWISARRRWPALPLSAFLGTLLLTGQWFARYYSPAFPGDDRAVALCGNGALWLFYFALPLWAARRPSFWATSYAFIVALNGFAFAALVHEVLAPDLAFARGLALAVLALLYGLGARLFERRNVPQPAPATVFYTAVALAAAAVAVQFDPEWVGLGWVLLGLVLIRAGVRFRRPADRWVGAALLILAAGRALFIVAPRVFHRGDPFTAVANPDFLLGATVALGVVTGGVWTRRSDGHGGAGLADTLIVGGALLLLVRVTIESLAWHETRAAAFGSGAGGLRSLLTLSFLWAVYGGLLVALGFAARYRPLRILGIGLFALLCLKIFGVDLSGLSGGYRIASFFGVGLLLVVISVLYQKERRR